MLGEGLSRFEMSRLDRLVLLLDQGSSSGIKRNASMQLAEIINNRPQDLASLLNKIVPLLGFKSWDTRTQTAITLGRMQIPVSWNERDLPFLDFDDFNQLKKGVLLLESPGEEYEAFIMEADEQKRSIKEKLGLEIGKFVILIQRRAN